MAAEKYPTGSLCPQDGEYKIRCYPETVKVKKGEKFPTHPKTGKDTNFTLK